MNIIDTNAVVALLFLVAVAGVAGVFATAFGLAQAFGSHRPSQLASHASAARFYGHLVLGH